MILVVSFVYFVVLLCFLLLSYKFLPGIDYTFNKFFNNNATDYSTGRFDMYKEAYRLYVDNSYFPIGWGQYAKSTNYHHPALHNDYLQLFFETGMLGLFLIIMPNIIFLIKSIKFVNKKHNEISVIILIFNLFFMTYSLTGLPHYDVEVYMIYFIFNSFLIKLCMEGDSNEEI